MLSPYHRYLSQYNRRKVTDFFSVISRWDTSVILNAAASTSTASSTVQPPPKLSRLPPSLVYLILSDPVVASHSSIRSLIQSASESASTAGQFDVQVNLDRRFPFFGEGHLALLLDRPSPILPTEGLAIDLSTPPPDPSRDAIRGFILSHLLPSKQTIPLDRLSFSLPTIERLLFLISYPATPVDQVREAWDLLRLLLDKLDEGCIRDGLIGDGKGDEIKLPRSDRWLDEKAGERSRWRRIAPFLCGQLGERVDCE